VKYGIISDIHGNLEALEVVLEYLKKEKVGKYICGGDIIGYGANPNECIEIVRELKALSVLGNHEAASLGLKDKNWFNIYARKAIIWTAEKLGGENKSYLKSLPEIATSSCPDTKASFTLVHGSPRKPLDEYLLKKPDLEENLPFFDTPLCLVGHTHIPFCFYSEVEKEIPGEGLSEGGRLKLENKGKVIVNVGSVGQPRDGDPRASTGIYDSERKEIEFKRIPYDIQKTQEKIIKAGLPQYLALRLAEGK
jgi:predicted phosphodiesterase